MYYKYTSIEKLDRIIDVFKNNRLYAANYKDLNDPMEGFYLVNNQISQQIIQEIKTNKHQFRICAFTTTDTSKLMWAHYADSFKGAVLGFDTNELVDDVSYDGLYMLDKFNSTSESIQNIFKHKFGEWEYESEKRVITQNNKQYIKVIPTVLIFGLLVDKNIKEMIVNYFNNHFPNVLLKHQIRRNANISIVNLNQNEL